MALGSSTLSPGRDRLLKRGLEVQKIHRELTERCDQAATLISEEEKALDFAKKRLAQLLSMPLIPGQKKLLRTWQNILRNSSRKEIAEGLRGNFPEQVKSTEPITIAWKFRDRL